MAHAVKARTGGRLVAETLEALGIEVAFGVPGIHALAIWDGLRTSSISTIGFRTELNAGFAADGYARSTGKPAALLLSTGPGALVSLASLMEAASAHVPVLAIASQIPSDLIGRGRGYLHELADQLASFAPVVKWADARRIRTETCPSCSARRGARPDSPVRARCSSRSRWTCSAANRDSTSPRSERFAPDGVAPAQGRSTKPPGCSTRPSAPSSGPAGACCGQVPGPSSPSWLGRLDAPVATTYMGKGAFPADDPLSAGSACDEGAYKRLLGEADVLLAVGTELGAETTAQYGLELSGKIVQIDAAESGSAPPIRPSASPATPAGSSPALKQIRKRDERRRRARGPRAGTDRAGARRTGSRARTRPAEDDPRRRPARGRHLLGHDDPRLLGRRALPGQRAAARSSTRSDRARSATPGRPLWARPRPASTRRRSRSSATAASSTGSRSSRPRASTGSTRSCS